MWSFLTITSASIGSYYVIDAVLGYLRFKTVSKIEVITEKQVPFPAISICAYPNFNNSFNKTNSYTRFNDILETDFNKYEEFYDVILGKCFRYNSGKNIYNHSYEIHKSTIKGIKYGYRVNMFIQIPNEYDFVEIYLFIHNQSLPPFDTFSGHGYWIMPGSFNYFEVERVFYQKLEAPYSDCLKDVKSFKLNKTLIEYILQSKRAYTQIDCYYVCSHLYALKESNCSCNSSLEDFSMNCIRQYKLDDTKIQKCVSNYLEEFRKNDQNEKCSTYCPLQCDSMDYLITPLNEQLPVSGNISKMSKVDYFPNGYNTYEEVKQNYLAIRVFYKELDYTLISEEPETESFNFVSNIGGILGLFLGISFLSFIEIFELLFEILFIFFN